MLQRYLRVGAIGIAVGLSPLLLALGGNPSVSLYEIALFLPFVFAVAAAFLGERLHLRPLTLFSTAVLGGYLSLFPVPGLQWIETRPDNLFALVGLLTVLAVALCFIKQEWLLAIPVLPQVIVTLAVFTLLPRLYPDHSWVVRTWTWRASVPVLSWVNWAAVAALAGLAYRRFVAERPTASTGLLAAALMCFWTMEGLLLAGRHALLPTDLFVSVPVLCGLSFILYGELYLYWQRIYVDELTGVFNRRALNERLWDLRPHYSIAMVDIDFFKRFNDTFGHEQGDTVLRFVASHFQNPQHGTCYRYGGEEFCILFENISAPHASRILNQMREDLAKKTFHIRSSKQVRSLTSKKDRKIQPKTSKVNITVSIGVAEPQADHQTADDVLKAADAALYRAKHMGRNRVMESNPSATTFVTQLYKS